jgi:bifunctional pyridoxal-dependent enzyme with beta-cystathionase and maltose regulon repressor activities
VLVEPGARFGAGSAGFLRVNLACGQERLMMGLERAVPVLRSALEEARR